MKDSIIILPELFTAFNNVTYFDDPHKYYVNGNELISVTTLLHKYTEKFDEKYWSEYKANEFNLEPYEIVRAWKFINRKGTMKGSIAHDYAENLFLNKVFKYPKQEILNEFGFDPVIKEYEITKKHIDNFYNDVKKALVPIKTEYVVYDDELFIGGMLDMLFYNKKAKEFQIWDWKTNKAFTYEQKERHLLHELYMIEASDLEIYSLQLEMYKQIIEKNTSIKLGQSHIVLFSHNNDEYKVIKTKDRQFHVKNILNKRKEELAA